MKLSGDKSRCVACGLVFRSTSAFDKHRTGSFRNMERRCLTESEMTEKGMVKGASGVWVGSKGRFPTLADTTLAEI